MAMDNDDLIHLDNDSLVSEWGTLRDTIGPLRDRMLAVEYALQRNMERDGATEYHGPAGGAKLAQGSPRIDQDALDALYEYLSPQELADKGAVVPRHDETVERRWNLTRLKPFARRGTAVAEIIEGARDYPRPTLKVTPVTGENYDN